MEFAVESPITTTLSNNSTSSFTARRTSYGRLPFRAPIEPYWSVNRPSNRCDSSLSTQHKQYLHTSVNSRHLQNQSKNLSTSIPNSLYQAPHAHSQVHLQHTSVYAHSRPSASNNIADNYCRSSSDFGVTNIAGTITQQSSRTTETKGLQSNSISNSHPSSHVPSSKTSTPIMNIPSTTPSNPSIKVVAKLPHSPKHPSPTTVRHNGFDSSPQTSTVSNPSSTNPNTNSGNNVSIVVKPPSSPVTHSLTNSSSSGHTASLKVVPNALTIRRSRRARKHTVRSVTPSPPRRDPTISDLQTWPSSTTSH